MRDTLPLYMITYSTPKKSYYFVWSEYSALVLIAEKPLNSFYIINPWISWELNIIERSPSPIIANHFVELLRLGFQQVFPSHSLPNFDSISLWGIPCLCIWLLIQRQKSYYFFLLEYSALVLIAEKPLNNFSIINPLNFMRAEYNWGMTIPNNYQSFCVAPKIGILADFPLPFSPKFW